MQEQKVVKLPIAVFEFWEEKNGWDIRKETEELNRLTELCQEIDKKVSFVKIVAVESIFMVIIMLLKLFFAPPIGNIDIAIFFFSLLLFFFTCLLFLFFKRLGKKAKEDRGIKIIKTGFFWHQLKIVQRNLPESLELREIRPKIVESLLDDMALFKLKCESRGLDTVAKNLGKEFRAFFRAAVSLGLCEDKPFDERFARMRQVLEKEQEEEKANRASDYQI